MEPDEIRRTDERFKPSKVIAFGLVIGIVALVLVRFADGRNDSGPFIKSGAYLHSLTSFGGKETGPDRKVRTFKYLAPSFFIARSGTATTLVDGKWRYIFDGSHVSVTPAPLVIDPIAEGVPSLAPWFSNGAPAPLVFESVRHITWGEDEWEGRFTDPAVASEARKNEWQWISVRARLPMHLTSEHGTHRADYTYDWQPRLPLKPQDFEIHKVFTGKALVEAAQGRALLENPKMQTSTK